MVRNVFGSPHDETIVDRFEQALKNEKSPPKAKSSKKKAKKKTKLIAPEGRKNNERKKIGKEKEE